MAREELKQPSREEVAGIVDDARRQNKNKKNHTRAEIEKRYPGLKTATVRRNGLVYNALDYLSDDVDSYGSPAQE